MTPHIVSLGGRRFILTLGCGMACTVLVWHGKVSDQIFRDIIIATVAAYIAGNTVEKVKAPQADQ
jgi:hypothetical protein